jgi:hypothetical protein
MTSEYPVSKLDPGTFNVRIKNVDQVTTTIKFAQGSNKIISFSAFIAEFRKSQAIKGQRSCHTAFAPASEHNFSDKQCYKW